MIKSIYRVPLDFDWPIGVMWEGFVNPYHGQFVICPHCDGYGISREAEVLKDIWYGARRPIEHNGVADFGEIECEYSLKYHFTRELNSVVVEANHHRINDKWMYLLDRDDVATLVEHHALLPLTHRWEADAWIAKDAVHLTPVEVNVFAYEHGVHDFMNAWIAIEGVCRRANLQYHCPHCKGQGGAYPDLATHQAAVSWTPFEPARGEAYQFWVPGNQGAPLSPVFATPEALADWLIQHAGTAQQGLKRDKCVTYVASEGTRGLPQTTFIGLYRKYQMNLRQVFHPADRGSDLYSSS